MTLSGIRFNHFQIADQLSQPRFVVEPRMLEALLQEDDKLSLTRPLFLEYGFHLSNGGTARSCEVCDEAIPEDDIRLTEIHRADVDHWRFIGDLAVDLQDGVMNP